jgi:hypothetical protein
MKLDISISLDNAAFVDNGVKHELRPMLDRIGDGIEAGETDGKLRDSNGNTVGSWSVA